MVNFGDCRCSLVIKSERDKSGCERSWEGKRVVREEGKGHGSRIDGDGEGWRERMVLATLGQYKNTGPLFS